MVWRVRVRSGVAPLGTGPGAAQTASLDGGSSADRPMASNDFAGPSSPGLRAIPRETRSSAAAVLRCAAALRVQAGRTVADRPPSRPRWAASRNSQEIRQWLRSEPSPAPTTEASPARSAPSTSASRRASSPSPRRASAALTWVAANGVELGAGWSKAAKDTGAEYVSVKLDDPSFTAPVYATLVASEKGEHRLIWSR